MDIFYDPQTSGGLLLALSSADAETLLDLRRSRSEPCAVIGRVGLRADGNAYIRVK